MTFLHVDSVATEPAVPLNLALDVRVLTQHRMVEVKAMLAKRQGYPAELFFARDIRAEITLVPGLRLANGSLTWSGELRGEQRAEFVTRLSVADDIDGVVYVAARGHTHAGDIDADTESFRVVAHGEGITIARDVMPVISPMRPGTAQRSD